MKAPDHIAAHVNGLRSSIHALEVQITILKQLVGVSAETEAETSDDDVTAGEDDAPVAPKKKMAKPAVEEEEVDADEDEDFAPKKKSASKKAVAAAFDDEEEEEADFDEPAPKKKKAKKVTREDVNSACKEKARSIGGKEGIAKVKALLKKHFKTESVSEIPEDQYQKCIDLMAV